MVGGNQRPSIVPRLRRTGARVVVTGAAGLEREELPDAIGHPPAGEVRLAHVEPRQILLRQVQATAFEVGGNVAQDVRQLQRDAKIDGIVACITRAENLQADQADRGSDPPAVFVEVVEGDVACAIEIHFDAVDQVRKRLPRQREPRQPWLQPIPLRRSRVTVVAAIQLVAPFLQCRPGSGDAGGIPSVCGLLVNRVVDCAAEIPHGDHRLALIARQHEKRVVERGWPAHRCHLNARQAIGGTSLARRLGRWRKTS